MSISKAQSERFTRHVSKAAKALARSAFDVAALDVFDYDESELDEMREQFARDCERELRHA